MTHWRIEHDVVKMVAVSSADRIKYYHETFGHDYPVSGDDLALHPDYWPALEVPSIGSHHAN